MEMLYEFEFEDEYRIGKSIEDDLEIMLEDFRQANATLDEEQIKKAFYMCIEYHDGQMRSSGNPYYLHPIKVAMILVSELQIFDTESVIVCLLHDTIEDVEAETEKELQEERIRRAHRIKKEFGQDVLDLVFAVTKIKHEKTSKEQDKAATHRKLFLSLIKDVRVILVKLADRLHNMRTLHYIKSTDKQKTIALETLNFYTPIAHRLGLNKIKMELEDRSLYFTDRIAYEAIKVALKEKRRDFLQYIAFITKTIDEKLNEEQVKNVITIVHKHIYEIYKMLEEGAQIEDIDNFYSLVITSQSNDKYECYKIHGILVNIFNPVNKLIDNIAQPKINFYQSLNTSLFGPDGKLVEVIIRTNDMDRLAEGGIANNFSIKEGRVRALEITDKEITHWGQWMEAIIDEKGEEATQTIWNSIKNNLFDAEVMVFTEEGQIVKLPAHACPIDFAFAIDNELGMHCISAKINGEVKALNYELQNGDKVNIISSPNAFPRPEWQNFVISHKAESLLHRFFKDNPAAKYNQKSQKQNFNVKLIIKGEDYTGMLQKITEAIDQANIRRISLDTFNKDFGGAITVNVRDYDHLNGLYAKLFAIDGIHSVEQMDDD